MVKTIGKKTFWAATVMAMLSLAACNFNENGDGDDPQGESDTSATVETTENPTASTGRYAAGGDTASEALCHVVTAAETPTKKSKTPNGGSKWETRTERRQADVLHNKIVASAQPIIEKGLAELKKDLAKFELNTDWDGRRQDILSCFTPYGEDLYCITREDDRCIEFAWNDNALVTLTADRQTFTSYDLDKQQEISHVIHVHYVSIMRKLKENRVALSKPYACYYPVLDLTVVPEDYQEMFCGYDPAVIHRGGDIRYGYDDLSTAPLCIKRRVQIRSKDLDPTFFNVQGASYKVVKVSKGSWRIDRTSASGSVESTPTFKYNADYVCIWESAEHEDRFGVVVNDKANVVQITEEVVLYKIAATKDDRAL